MGLCVGLPHPNTMPKLIKLPCIKTLTNKLKNIKSFSHKKEYLRFVIEVIRFNLKDSFISAREPLICGIIFCSCPIVSIVQTVRKVVLTKISVVALSDFDLKRVFRKTLENLVNFENTITFDTKMLAKDHQDWCRLNNWSIFIAFFTWITWRTEPLIF